MRNISPTSNQRRTIWRTTDSPQHIEWATRHKETPPPLFLAHLFDLSLLAGKTSQEIASLATAAKTEFQSQRNTPCVASTRGYCASGLAA
jgi:hypothetical protein